MGFRAGQVHMAAVSFLQSPGTASNTLEVLSLKSQLQTELSAVPM